MGIQTRPLDQTDTVLLCSWIETERDVIVWRGPYFEYPLTPPAAFEPLIAEHVGENPTRECWAVIDEDQVIVGSFQLSYNPRTGQADLGRVIINPLRRGQGLASQLVRLSIHRAFSRTSIHRLELRVYDFNTAAVATYLKAGFVSEGIRRESVRVGKEYWNTEIMGILRTELKDGVEK